MMPQTKARLIAALAFPLLLLHGAPARSQAITAPAAAMEQLPHISVQATGQGSAVILIPGLSSPRAVWDGVAPALAKRHRVLTVQVNGFGGDAPGANLQPGILDGVVAELHALIGRQRLGNVAVVGHSLGGLVALMLAKAHPEDVGRLMIVDALPFVGDIFVPNATVAMLAPQAAAMRDRLAAQYGKPGDPAADAAVAAGQALTPTARATVAGWIGKADPRVTAQALFEDLSTDLRPDIAAIATPITVVYPYSDMLPRERAAAVYRGAYARAPAARFVEIGGSGHFMMLDQPAAFAAAITAFAG